MPTPAYVPPQQQPAPIYRTLDGYNQQQGQQTTQNSRSESRNEINTSGSLSNIQVNNYNPGKLELVNVGSKQVPTLSISTWTSSLSAIDDTGFSVTFNIPLGGQEAFDKIASQRIRARDQQYAVDTIAICTKLNNAGIDISGAQDPKIKKLRQSCKGILFGQPQANSSEVKSKN